MESLLTRVTASDVQADPFPFVIRPDCLSVPSYSALAETCIDYFTLVSNSDKLRGRSNYAFAVSGMRFLRDLPWTGAGGVPAIWREFFEFHVSQPFYRQMISLLGPHIRRLYPGLEARFDRPLEDLRVAWRRDAADADVLIDCQFTFNTPVTAPSRVRGVHVDKPTRLYSGLFYMRHDEDDSVGGDLELLRFVGKRRFFENVAVRDEFAERFATVPYRANTLVMFVNSPDSLHSVSERAITPHPRRYINFLAELREPLLDLSQYQE